MGAAHPCENALDLIGNTRLLSLKRAYQGSGRICAKAEFVQPAVARRIGPPAPSSRTRFGAVTYAPGSASFR
jgi:hypothetical protein